MWARRITFSANTPCRLRIYYCDGRMNESAETCWDTRMDDRHSQTGDPFTGRRRLSELLARYEADLRRVVAGMGFEPADADDILQDVHMRALRSRRDYRGEDEARGWLLRVTVNRCRLEFRRRERFRRKATDMIARRQAESRPTGGPRGRGGPCRRTGTCPSGLGEFRRDPAGSARAEVLQRADFRADRRSPGNAGWHRPRPGCSQSPPGPGQTFDGRRSALRPDLPEFAARLVTTPTASCPPAKADALRRPRGLPAMPGDCRVMNDSLGLALVIWTVPRPTSPAASSAGSPPIPQMGWSRGRSIAGHRDSGHLAIPAPAHRTATQMVGPKLTPEQMETVAARAGIYRADAGRRGLPGGERRGGAGWMNGACLVDAYPETDAAAVALSQLK